MARRAREPRPADAGPRDVPFDYHDDAWVEVFPESGLISETARALLDAAERCGYDPGRAVHAIGGGFRVPADVLDIVEFPTEPASDGHRIVATPLAAEARGAVPNPPPDVTDASS